MSRERGCSGRMVRLGCGAAVLALLAVGALVLYGPWTAPADRLEPTPSEREAAAAKVEGIERSLRTRQPFETRFDEAELTLLAREYLAREGIEGELSVTLPDDDVLLSFRTPIEELGRWVELERLPSGGDAEVRGTLRIHVGVADDEPFAELEGVSLYGVPMPLSLLGPAAEGNWLDRLEGDAAAAVRRIRSLEVRDQTLLVGLD